MAHGHITPGPSCDLVRSPSPNRLGPAWPWLQDLWSQPGDAVTQLVAPPCAHSHQLPQHHPPWQSPGPRDQGLQSIPMSGIVWAFLRGKKHFKRENFEVFKEVGRENICPVLNKRFCLKQSKQLSVLSPPTPRLELPKKNEWKGKPLIDLARFYHLFS